MWTRSGRSARIARWTSRAIRGLTSRPQRTEPVRDAQPVELLIEAPEVGSGNVEPEEAGVDAALAQRGQQREQVALGAADPGELVQVEDLHRSRRP